MKDDLVIWYFHHLIDHTLYRHLHLSVFDLFDLVGHFLGNDLPSLPRVSLEISCVHATAFLCRRA